MQSRSTRAGSTSRASYQGVAAAVIAKAGISWCFGLNALSYFTVLVSLGRIAAALDPAAHSGLAVTRHARGASAIRATKKVATLIRFIAVFSVLGVPYITLMPVVARDLLGPRERIRPAPLSLGLGGLSGALALAAAGGRVPRGKPSSPRPTPTPFLLIMFAGPRRVAGVSDPFATGFSMIVTNAVANSMLQSFVAD
jgi:hypothetical protein